MINFCHIICQSDQIVKADGGVIVRCLNFLNMVTHAKKETIPVFLVFISVEYDLSFFVCRQRDLLCIIGVSPEINVRVLCKDLELYSFEFFICVITVTFDDRKVCQCSLAF